MSFYGGYTGLGAMYAGANYEEGHALHCAWGAGADCDCGKDPWSDAAPNREGLPHELETAGDDLEDETFDWDQITDETPLPVELWDNDGEYLDTTGLLDEVHDSLIYGMDNEWSQEPCDSEIEALPPELLEVETRYVELTLDDQSFIRLTEIVWLDGPEWIPQGTPCPTTLAEAKALMALRPEGYCDACGCTCAGNTCCPPDAEGR